MSLTKQLVMSKMTLPEVQVLIGAAWRLGKKFTQPKESGREAARVLICFRGR